MRNKEHIIIGGSPRSGSTALARLSAYQNDFVITNEFGTYNAWDDKTKWKGFEKAKHYSSFKANELLFKERGFDLYDFRREVINNKMSGQDVFVWLQKNMPAKFYGDKCPMSYLERMVEHSETFPNAKFVITIRDGRDVITSQIANYRRVGKQAHWMRPTVEDSQYLWLKCAQMVINNLKQISRDRLFLFRYEDMPLKEFGHFIHPELEIDNKSFYKPRVGVWRKEHTDMMDRLSDEFKEMLERFGY